MAEPRELVSERDRASDATDPNLYNELNDWLIDQLKLTTDFVQNPVYEDEEFANMIYTEFIKPSLPPNHQRHHVTKALLLLVTKQGLNPTGVGRVFDDNPDAIYGNEQILKAWPGPEMPFRPGVPEEQQQQAQREARQRILFGDDPYNEGITKVKFDDGIKSVNENINNLYLDTATRIRTEVVRRIEERRSASDLRLDRFDFQSALAAAGLSMSGYTLAAKNTLISEGRAMFKDLHDEERISMQTMELGALPDDPPPIKKFITDLLKDNKEIRESWLAIVSEELGTEYNLTEEAIAAGKKAEGYPVTHPITGETTFHDKTTAEILEKEYDEIIKEQEKDDKAIRDAEIEARGKMALIPPTERMYLALKDTPLFAGKNEKYIRTWIERKGPGIMREFSKQIAEEISEGKDPETGITTLEHFIGSGDNYDSKLPPKTYVSPAGVITDYATDKPVGVLSFSDRPDPKKGIFSPKAIAKALDEGGYSEETSKMEAAFEAFRRKEIADPKYQEKFMQQQRKDVASFIESPLISGAIEEKYAEQYQARKDAGVGLTVPGARAGLPTPGAIFPPGFTQAPEGYGRDKEPDVEFGEQQKKKFKEQQRQGEWGLGGLSTASLQDLGRVDTLESFIAKDKAASRKRFSMTAEGKQYAVIEKKRKQQLAQEKSQKTRRGKSTMGGIQPAPEWLLGRV
jgi:hypothetical protein